MNAATNSLELTARLFRTQASHHAVMGAGIALVTVILATLLACGVEFRSLSIEGLIAVQRSNPALWLLDLTPFAFALWGQYVGTMMAYKASALVLDETAELRQKASALEYQIEHGQAEGPRLGLPNRRALRSTLAQALSHPADQTRHPAILMIEIDQLRDVDRILGDEMAEDLMRIVAQRLQNIISREQVLAYLGHNEFGLLSTGAASVEGLQHQARRIHRALDTPVSMAGMQIGLQARIGAAIVEDGQHVDAEGLLRRAEVAKYAARTEEQDFQLYNNTLESRGAGRLSLTAELHSSLGNDGLTLAFAPQLRLADGRYHRMRLYPRWPHPHRGLLEETDFLNLPERGGLLHGLSLWLLQQGLEKLECWRRDDPEMILCIRLPDHAVTRLPLSEMLTRLLSAHDLPGNAIVLEFNESALRADEPCAMRHLDSLRKQGVGICLTGLGGACCSTVSLLDFPISEVRLASSLTLRAQFDAKAAKLLASYVGLVHEMSISCGAEGVSSHGQLELLQSLDCDWAEGSAIQVLRNFSDSTAWVQQQARN
jgi:diguanylate cyclase